MEGENTLTCAAHLQGIEIEISTSPIGRKSFARSWHSDAASGTKVAETELKQTLEGLAEHLFGKGIEVQMFCYFYHASRACFL